MKNYWTECSIGELMGYEHTSRIILEQVKGDLFLTNYFKTFGMKAKHTFEEVEKGSIMAGGISQEVLKNIKCNLLKECSLDD